MPPRLARRNRAAIIRVFSDEQRLDAVERLLGKMNGRPNVGGVG
jgi:hypothetical protein